MHIFFPVPSLHLVARYRSDGDHGQEAVQICKFASLHYIKRDAQISISPGLVVRESSVIPPGLRRSKARTEAQNRVFARADVAARAHSFPACHHLAADIFIRFKELRTLAKGSMMRPSCPTRISTLRECPPTCRDLALDTLPPSFSIEKHFVLQHTLYATPSTSHYFTLATISNTPKGGHF